MKKETKRNEREEQVLGGLYKTMQKVATELGRNMEAALETQKRNSFAQPKTAWGEWQHERGSSEETLIRKYTEAAHQGILGSRKIFQQKSYLWGN